MSGRLILVRHGQTVANVAKKLDTLPPGAPLTAAGEQQALALAERFGSGGRPAVLVSSVALRARQTATPVSETVDRGLEVVEGLHEVQAGDLEGRSDEDAHKVFMGVFRSWYKGDLDERIPGGESGHDALGRYLPQLDELRAAHLGRTDAGASGDIVVVSHGAIIRLAVTAMSDVDPAFAVTNHLDNTDAVVLAPTPDGGWRLEQWGDKLPPFEGPSRGGADDPMG
ncbi:histidine phosphatase family protein [Tomitella gaofuii]|uniref:histidine phosphatase family protein n=1 Tax=Tomitella gaofuii TaxID=2760083 RepID=UPI0015FA1E89|nr:histidine phosphatase family protein [Tomitella gaofuii]